MGSQVGRVIDNFGDTEEEKLEKQKAKRRRDREKAREEAKRRLGVN